MTSVQGNPPNTTDVAAPRRMPKGCGAERRRPRRGNTGALLRALILGGR